MIINLPVKVTYLYMLAVPRTLSRVSSLCRNAEKWLMPWSSTNYQNKKQKQTLKLKSRTFLQAAVDNVKPTTKKLKHRSMIKIKNISTGNGW